MTYDVVVLLAVTLKLIVTFTVKFWVGIDFSFSRGYLGDFTYNYEKKAMRATRIRLNE